MKGMASEENLSKLMLRTLMDDEFRHFLVKEPQEAAYSMGVELESSQVERLQELDAEELERLVSLLRRTLFAAAGTLW